MGVVCSLGSGESPLMDKYSYASGNDVETVNKAFKEQVSGQIIVLPPNSRSSNNCSPQVSSIAASSPTFVMP